MFIKLCSQIDKNFFSSRFELPQIFNSQAIEYLNKKKNEELLALEKLSKPFISVYSVCMNGHNFFSLIRKRMGKCISSFRDKMLMTKNRIYGIKNY